MATGSQQADKVTGCSIKVNKNWKDIITPVNATKLRDYLIQIDYDKKETDFLFNGFTEGFDLGYQGPMNRKDFSNNIPFTVGDKHELWSKMANEVELKHFAGPFRKEELPFSETIVQSPIGLVPKSGNKTRLIFHLSYNFKNGGKSINYWTPSELSSVHYNDLDKAVRDCIKLMEIMGVTTLYYSKSDLKSAFRVLPLRVAHCCLLVMKAEDPETGEWCFFIDLCLPFGASISCAHFQCFSNALRAIVEAKVNQVLLTMITNYLDDFLFVYITKRGCNQIVIIFLRICKDINFPVSEEKTEWAEPNITFLGMLLDGKNHTISIPLEKRTETLQMVHLFCDKKKATVKELQKLAGHLNFINRAVVPGCAFTRRMYAKFAGPLSTLKPYHHIRLDSEFKADCRIWISFLTELDSVVRPFIDLN